MTQATVLISGAGVAGPTLAYWLERAGYRPTLVERASMARGGGSLLDFWGLGWDVAEKMGLIQCLAEVGYQVQAIRNVNARGRTVARLSTRGMRNALDGRFLSLARGDLARALLDTVADRVEILWGDAIAGVVDDGGGVEVSFEHASARRFDLVVGADGLHSHLRRLVFGDEAQFVRDLGYRFCSFSSDGYAFRDDNEYVSFATVGRQITRYALRGGRTGFLMVWRGGPTGWESFAGDGWECREVLAAHEHGDDRFEDAVCQIRLPQWSRGRVTLVGDAAHAPSLLAGEGSAMGMAGAYLLACALASHPDDHAAAFAEYEARFHAVATRKQDTALRYAGWFAPKSRLGLRLRDLATNALGFPGLSGPLTRAMFREGVALPAFPG